MRPTDKVNFENLTIVLVDDNPQALDILAQVFAGFGVRNAIRCLSAAEAMTHFAAGPVDLLITDAQMPELDGYDFTRWVRRESGETNRFLPIVIVTAHTRRGDVLRARDCGANYIIAKPITPKTVLDRIMWISREDRVAIEADSYVGPDRRFRRQGPPAGMDGRRSGDLSTQVGEAIEPNMSQDAIDALLNPRKAAG